MDQDWIFQTEEGTCGFRSAGIMVRNGKVLLQRDHGEYAVPGGHVRIGETSEAAVIREFKEELGVQVAGQRLLWSEECFWNWKGKMIHTLCFYYLLEFSENSDFLDDGQFRPQMDNPRIEIGWVPFEALKHLTVYPEFLKERVYDLQPGHFITRA